MQKEYFVSENENAKIVEDTFIIIAYSLVCLIIVISLLWSYIIIDSTDLFILIYSLTYIIFGVVIISIIVINKDNYDTTSYRVLFNSSIFIIFLSFFIGLYIYPRTVEEENDPGSFVWDEFVGMWIACLPLAFLENSFIWLVISFFLFRLFDIRKPLGIKFFDKRHGALNVMMDDVIAGFYSGVLVIFLSTFFQ